jgi:hypothetical protein
VTLNGIPVRHFHDRAVAERYVIHPDCRASLVTAKLQSRRCANTGTAFGAVFLFGAVVANLNPVRT